MIGALWILLATIVIGIALYLVDIFHYRKRGSSGGSDEPDKPAGSGLSDRSGLSDESGGECCGRHAVCEKTSLSPLTDKAEYYDDEELDRYAGRAADSYSEEETEEFRDILMTMRADDVAGWSRSLQVRGIEPPLEIRDEILLIVSDLRHPK